MKKIVRVWDGELAKEIEIKLPYFFKAEEDTDWFSYTALFLDREIKIYLGPEEKDADISTWKSNDVLAYLPELETNPITKTDFELAYKKAQAIIKENIEAIEQK